MWLTAYLLTLMMNWDAAYLVNTDSRFTYISNGFCLPLLPV